MELLGCGVCMSPAMVTLAVAAVPERCPVQRTLSSRSHTGTVPLPPPAMSCRPPAGLHIRRLPACARARPLVTFLFCCSKVSLGLSHVLRSGHACRAGFLATRTLDVPALVDATVLNSASRQVLASFASFPLPKLT